MAGWRQQRRPGQALASPSMPGRSADRLPAMSETSRSGISGDPVAEEQRRASGCLAGTGDGGAPRRSDPGTWWRAGGGASLWRLGRGGLLVLQVAAGWAGGSPWRRITSRSLPHRAGRQPRRPGLSDVAEVGGSEHAQGGYREELRVDAGPVLEAVDLAAPDAQRVEADRTGLAVDRPGGDPSRGRRSSPRGRPRGPTLRNASTSPSEATPPCERSAKRHQHRPRIPPTTTRDDWPTTPPRRLDRSLIDRRPLDLAFAR
jgi:hypothetical protein